MIIPELVTNDGKLTSDGRALVQYITESLKHNLELPQMYWTYAEATKNQTPVQFFEDNPVTGALLWHEYQTLEENTMRADTPALVQNGTLTPEGRKVQRHMTALYDKVKDGMKNVPVSPRRDFMVMVNQTRTLSAVKYLTAYPSQWGELWYSYILSLPEDDPERLLYEKPTEMLASTAPAPDLENTITETRAIRSQVIALIEAHMNPLKHSSAPPLSETIQRLRTLSAQTPMIEGHGHQARLTGQGKTIVETLTRYLEDAKPDQLQPYATTIKAYLAYTQPKPQGARFMTPAEFFATFPQRAAELHTLAYDLLADAAREIDAGIKRVKLSTPSTRIVRG